MITRLTFTLDFGIRGKITATMRNVRSANEPADLVIENPSGITLTATDLPARASYSYFRTFARDFASRSGASYSEDGEGAFDLGE